MENPQLSSDFITMYHSTVRPLAVLCTPCFEIIKRIENGEVFDEEREEIKYLKTFHDQTTQWYIGLWIGYTDWACIEGTTLNFINSMGQVYGVMNSQSFWDNIWVDKMDTEEAQNLQKFKVAVSELKDKL